VILRLTDVHSYYGNIHALQGISLEVRAGEIVTLLGANGAGKTTAIRMLCGMLPPTGGEIHIAGVDVVRHPRAARS
jgi:ABC-type multidrug transport system ATPase subunit